MQSSSALVDLKAELCRKENELHDDGSKITSGKGKGKKTFAKIHERTGDKKKRKKPRNDKCEEAKGNEMADETLQLLERARHKLEAKAKIYEKMRNGEMEDVENIYGETKFLVDFQHKYYTEVDDEEKWLNQSFSDSTIDTDAQTPNNSKNSSLLFEMGELRREQMREKWEKEQEELLNGPVHYENVKFDEIRNLGTGYFAFSKDEEERKKQMEDLQNLRESTKTAQNKKEILTKKRKAALQERLDKVKIRKYGTVAEEKVACSEAESVHPISNDKSLVDKISHVDDATNAADTDSSKQDVEDDVDNYTLQPEDEETLNLCRKDSQKEREWDKGKNPGGFTKQIFVKSKGAAFYEGLVDEKRSERENEFAPPDFY